MSDYNLCSETNCYILNKFIILNVITFRPYANILKFNFTFSESAEIEKNRLEEKQRSKRKSGNEDKPRFNYCIFVLFLNHLCSFFI